MNLQKLLNESNLSVKEHLKNYSKYFELFYNATDGIIKNAVFRLEISDKPEIILNYGGKVDSEYNEEKIKEKLKVEFKNYKIKKCECFVGSNKTMICKVVLNSTNEIKKNKLFFKIENANLKLKLYYVNAEDKIIILNNNMQAINLIKFLSN